MEHPSSQQPASPTDNLPPTPTTPTPTPQQTTTTTTTTTQSSLLARRLAKAQAQAQAESHPHSPPQKQTPNPHLLTKLTQLSLPLAPLVQLTTGRIHPAFPRTLLAFWLLTDAQLDDLAHFYHQRTPGPWTRQYPCPVRWPRETGAMGIEAKRRKLGRFIGLRGCESPVFFTGLGVDGEGDVEMGGLDLGLDLGLGDGVREMVGRSEEEIVEAARRERLGELGDEVEEMRRKMGWY